MCLSKSRHMWTGPFPFWIWLLGFWGLDFLLGLGLGFVNFANYIYKSLLTVILPQCVSNTQEWGPRRCVTSSRTPASLCQAPGEDGHREVTQEWELSSQTSAPLWSSLPPGHLHWPRCWPPGWRVRIVSEDWADDGGAQSLHTVACLPVWRQPLPTGKSQRSVGGNLGG